MFMSEKVKVPGGEGAVERPDLPGRPPASGPRYDRTGQHAVPSIRRWLCLQNTPGSFSVLMRDTWTSSSEENRAR